MEEINAYDHDLRNFVENVRKFAQCWNSGWDYAKSEAYSCRNTAKSIFIPFILPNLENMTPTQLIKASACVRILLDGYEIACKAQDFWRTQLSVITKLLDIYDPTFVINSNITMVKQIVQGVLGAKGCINEFSLNGKITKKELALQTTAGRPKKYYVVSYPRRVPGLVDPEPLGILEDGPIEIIEEKIKKILYDNNLDEVYGTIEIIVVEETKRLSLEKQDIFRLVN